MTAPAPTVVGPIMGARAPWAAPEVDLAALGYTVEEFQLDGTLSGYQLRAGSDATVDGRWAVEPYGDAPYRTRILVVRPACAQRFNGTVVVEWLNVSAGVELGGPTGNELYEGYAWVGVSAQEVGLYGFPPGMARYGSRRARPLLEHDPERYGSLHHPGDQGAYDIFSDAGRAVGPNRATTVDPMGGLEVQRLIAQGGSQSAMRLVTYLNAFHADAQVYDAFLLSVWEGRAPRPEEGAIAMGVRTSIRTDHPTPVVVVNSEFEVPHLAALPIADTDHLRIWEVAGAPHGVARHAVDEPDARGRVVNRLSIRPVHDAALRAVHRRLTTGAPLPSQPRVVVDDDRRSTICRDQFGNALGGIRLPELAAPTCEYRGVAFGTGRAPLFGSARPFADADLRRLYRTREVFVRAWCDAVDALVASAAVRPEDAGSMRARADEFRLPVD
jgi:hypothetical protein